MTPSLQQAPALKVLLIEDNPRDVRLIQEILSESGNSFQMEWASSLNAGLKRLEADSVDIVLLDLSLPDSNWSDTFAAVRRRTLRTPIVVLSGVGNEQNCLQTLRQGAQDYLVKGEVDHHSLVRTLLYAVERQKMQDQFNTVYLKVEKDLRQTEDLVRFSHKLNLVFNLEDLWGVMREFFPSLFQAERFSAFLLNPATGALELMAHNHPEWNGARFAVPENGGMMWDAVRSREMIRVERYSQSKYSKPWNGRKYKKDGAISAPLVAKNKVLGVLNLNEVSEEGMSEEQLSHVKRTVDYLSLAIHNALLLKQIEELTVQDELTLIYNRRYFQQTIEKEIRNVQRYPAPLSVIMLDIDYFKKLNDSYGHATGDAVLKAVAQRIRNALRPTDIPCRLGGDEFFIILPKTDADHAGRLARRLQEEILPQRISLDNGSISVTVSAGITQLHKDEVSEPLVARADRALYTAKEEGRNRCVLVP